MNITAAQFAAIKKRRPVPRPEREAQRAVLDYLSTVRGVVAWRNNVGAVTTKNRAGRARHVRFGFAGMSDIGGWVEWCVEHRQAAFRCATWPVFTVPVVLAIEVKRLGQVPSRRQSAYLDLVRLAGGYAIVAYSVDDVRNALGAQ